MPTTILRERPNTPDASALIEELEAELEPLYPRESRHGYSVDKLIEEDVAFFVIRHDGAPAGCGGVKFVGVEYGELKRMYVRPEFRGRDLAKLMLNHLEDFARSAKIGILRLETTRGDRLFITLLGSAYINLAWLFFFGAPLTWPLILSLLYAAAVFRWV